jgi:hypothetical protein
MLCKKQASTYSDDNISAHIQPQQQEQPHNDVAKTIKQQRAKQQRKKQRKTNRNHKQEETQQARDHAPPQKTSSST